MSLSRFDKSIRDCIEIASECSVLLQAGTVNSLDASGEFKSMSRKIIQYSRLYDIGTAQQDFNLMLDDRAFFQFSEIGDQLRYAFYPCPFEFITYREDRKAAEDLLDSGDLTDSEFEQLLSEINISPEIPVVRFDYSPAQRCKLYHPSAHLHIGHVAENRWPVGRVLSPKAFFLSTLYHYYPKLWKAQERAEGENWLDDLYRTELGTCDLLNDEEFEAVEKERLFFS